MIKYAYILSVLLLASCATKKDIIYTLPDAGGDVAYEFKELVIQKGDVLDIKVTSLNPESTMIFQNSLNQFQNQQPEILKLQGYLVDASGEITFPVLGSVKADGLSTTELSKSIQQELKQYIKDATVRTRLVNYKVSVLGEVVRPGTYTYLEEQITLPQVLGTAGDLTINGDRRNINLVRKVGDALKTYNIDLTVGDLINPDYFYLQQNDMVYVRPNTARVKSSGLIGNVGTLVSVLSLVVSLTILITR
ncbi:polysaccharide biosynthesis/export family protein [Flavobacteriaceae bacterium]|nr:polysaccharide biosynthesis/export family protein [Flavobacteriaceae bacterium]